MENLCKMAACHFHPTTICCYTEHNTLYVEDISRKISKVKTNYLRHDPFISFQAFGNLSHCQEQLLTTCDNVFNKRYLLDNYNHLRYNKSSVSGIK